MKRTPLKPGKPLKRGKPLARQRMKQRPRSTRNDFPEEVKADVRRRSGNRCEIRADEVCTGRATQFHHRKLRRHGDNREVNCLHGCDPCHEHVHANPGKSYLMGWLVRAELDPARVPVKRGAGGA